jgi:aldose 1-epimerase
MPETGGSIAQWCVGDQQMLRACKKEDLPHAATNKMASFSLVPFSNRIENAAFNWKGTPQKLEPQSPHQPHAIHGCGWKKSWHVARASDDQAEFVLHHQPDAAWPWAFSAHQIFTLTEQSLTLELSAQNLEKHEVPLGFGHHPYFDAAGATLQFTANAVWAASEDNLPTHSMVPKGDFDFSQSSTVTGRVIDNCYTGCGSTAHIKWQDRPYSLDIISSASLPAAVIYIPKEGGYFCYEPVPHLNNALNRPHDTPAMPVIAPQDYYRAQIIFQAAII